MNVSTGVLRTRTNLCWPVTIERLFLIFATVANLCRSQEEDVIIPVKSHNGVVVIRPEEGVRTMFPTKVHVVDPWIRPPRGAPSQQALDQPGDFALYPRIVASPWDRIDFIMRPIVREGDNTQRHGVYLITDHDLIRDYMEGRTDNPCGEPVFTETDLCQVMSHQGLNGTSCPHRQTLFPLVEIFGASGTIPYSVTNLEELANRYGLPYPTDDAGSGRHIVVFDCPWIQGRANVDGRVTHCTGGMYLVVEVMDTPPGEALSSAIHHFPSWTVAFLVSLMASLSLFCG